MPLGSHSREGAFTLIEILLSILIISMLMVLAFATNRALRESAKRRQAALEIRAIEQALLSYRQTYGTWPLLANAAPSKVAVTNIIAVLCNDDDFGKNAEVEQANPRDIVCLELPGTESPRGVKYSDPWGKQYQMALRCDEDGKFSHKNIGDSDFSKIECFHADPEAFPALVWTTAIDGRQQILSWEADP